MLDVSTIAAECAAFSVAQRQVDSCSQALAEKVQPLLTAANSVEELQALAEILPATWRGTRNVYEKMTFIKEGQ